MAPPERSEAGRTAVLATIPSDSHTWNLVFLQLVLEECGYTVRNLGACTSVSTTLRACAEAEVDLLVVSSVNGHGRREGAALVSALRADPELATLPAVIGGLPTTFGDDARAAAELLGTGYDRVFLGDSAESDLRSYLAQSIAPGRRAHRRPPLPAPVGLGEFVATRAALGELLVQPRMGFGSTTAMRAGLAAVHSARATTVGTLTLDSYTRVGDETGASQALHSGADLNGYPLLAHGRRSTRAVLEGIAGPDFPVQVRHGSALPSRIVAGALESGLSATEGGPVSYCLPYSRVPLSVAVKDWEESCRLLAATPGSHLESFGGCMMGQLCPPSLLVALSLLECLFFRRHGMRSVSLSYAQQTNHRQDREALAALRSLAAEFLGDIDWHIVVYTYMGVFPKSPEGAQALLLESARLAVESGSERLIVKTVAEAQRIPTVEENVAALESSSAASVLFRSDPWGVRDPIGDTGIMAEARALVARVLDISDDLGEALVIAFRRGFLDVPYCLHPDNRNRARTTVLPDGTLRWASVGAMPLPTDAGPAEGSAHGASSGSAELLRMLGWVRRQYDAPAVDRALVS